MGVPTAAQAAKAGIPAANYRYQLAHVNDNRGAAIMATGIFMSVLATFLVALRFAVRRLNKNAWKADDYAITLSLVLAWVLFGMCSLSEQPAPLGEPC